MAGRFYANPKLPRFRGGSGFHGLGVSTKLGDDLRPQRTRRSPGPTLMSSPLFATRRARCSNTAAVAVESVVLLGIAADDPGLLDLLVAAIQTRHTLGVRAQRAELRSRKSAVLHPIRPASEWIGAAACA
jgi:hypothetical protein